MTKQESKRVTVKLSPEAAARLEKLMAKHGVDLDSMVEALIMASPLR
jgi:hypothetical protein